MATPPFNPNVPLATSSPSQDQPVLLANSQTWFQTWNADGVTAGSSTNAGFSNQRTFVRRTSAPPANELNGQVFSMEDASGVAQLFWLAAAQDGSGLSQLTSNAPGEVPSGSSGYYAYTMIAYGVTFTIEQTYWAISGGLQIKALRIAQQTIPATGVTAYLQIVYSGTGGVAVPFASQPVYGTIYSYTNVTAASGAQGLITFSSVAPGALEQSGAFINAVNLGVSIAPPILNRLATFNVLVVGS